MAPGCLPLGPSRRMWSNSTVTLHSGTQLLYFFDKLPWSNYFYVKNYCYMGLHFLLPRCCLLNGNTRVMILTKFNLVTHHVVLWNSISLLYVVLCITIFFKGKFASVSPFSLLSLLPPMCRCLFKAQLPLEHLALCSQVEAYSLFSG